MAEFIEREKVKGMLIYNWDECCSAVIGDLESIPAADVVERKTCKNVAIEYDDCDQFICSECGIELQDWRRVERDEDDGDITYHEYRLRYCPNCGAKIGEN